MNSIRHIFIIAIFTSVLATPAMAANAMSANARAAFSQGHTHLSLVGGSGYAFNNNYFVIGAGASYFVLDGLSLGLHAETWNGGTPGIRKLTPSIQYVFYQVPGFQPYLGAYYRRTYIDELPDIDSTAGRAGIYISSGNNLYIGIGGVYESYLNCDETIYVKCTDSYPEFSITVAF